MNVLPYDRARPNDPPKPFTIDATFRLPIAFNEPRPLFGAVANNILSWQVVYEVGPPTRIVLYVRRMAQNSPEVREILTPVPLGEDIRVQVGRDGNRWLHRSTGADNQASYSELAAERQAYACPQLLIGAGLQVTLPPPTGSPPSYRPAPFPPPALPSGRYPLQGCPEILLVGTWSVYDRLLGPWNDTDDPKKELALLDTQIPDEKGINHARYYWPYGYGKQNGRPLGEAPPI